MKTLGDWWRADSPCGIPACGKSDGSGTRDHSGNDIDTVCGIVSVLQEPLDGGMLTWIL